MGAGGQIVISSDIQLRLTSTSTKRPEGPSPDSVRTIIIHPALDYFVVDNVSVGGFLVIAQTKQGDAKQSAIGLGPRVGYFLHLAEQVGFWPMGGLSYYTLSADPGGASGSKFQLNVFAPVTYSPVDHCPTLGGLKPSPSGENFSNL